MITNLEYHYYSLKFRNANNEIINFDAPQHYQSILGFIQVDDDMICILGGTNDTPDEQRRRNVVRINEHGEIVWVIMDVLDDYRKRFPGDDAILEHAKTSGFNGIFHMDGNKIVLNQGGVQYFGYEPRNPYR